ncbi:hypothetical protein UFOVP1383_52 [uncultured Caudovirales phage]|uniref:Uncharacterized protein n=1 Tax=uncultured Caudovirales phage TaxID=2100421 RepID=A0A6J5SMV6_9CAUD|nr:hypothetical protein UFOVP848_48 [uncultured Caudovirales phage]CAB4173100.1 hypothetical protein UFOVP945_17 [uncultured Caudovirales phage]CAB4179633.1 hypothetical protein UFOVP1023_25 [uncultured Caudovirales phage]CAB4204313.1 hypothetical protein UFOVP1383_52 [uncultured Caudovirales phage]CAB4216078.1 hypothetical protein UFOVP1477_55 [uncultured Caudovirales phage]
MRQLEAPVETFVAVYSPSPGSSDYLVVLNSNAPQEYRDAALRSLIRHHVYAHDRGSLFVLKPSGVRCPDCAKLAQRATRDPLPLELPPNVSLLARIARFKESS